MSTQSRDPFAALPESPLDAVQSSAQAGICFVLESRTDTDPPEELAAK